ncbi:uncharacterized protein RB166_011547 [Leptodactylus fuscus]
MSFWDAAGWNSEFDSTWEDEESEPPKKKKSQSQRMYGSRAARDMQNYRHGYGEPNDDNYQVHQQYMSNLEFYQNKIEFQPNGVTIEEFHQCWSEDYIELEENHSFIQWLFPLRERGVNPYATPLTAREIKKMKADQDVMKRFLNSYKIMLGFYGILLLDEETGKVSRAKNWKERFRNLNNHSHNNLRITRILKCLGELGFEHLQAPLVQFFLEETLCNNYLPNVKRSVLDYFMFTVKDKQKRRKLVYFAWTKYNSQKTFIWGPVEKLQNLKLKEEHDKQDKGNEITAENNTSNPKGSSGHHHNDVYQPHQYQQETGIEDSLEEIGDGGAFGGERLEDHEIGHGESSGYEDDITRNKKLIMEGNGPENKGQKVKKTQITEENISGNKKQTTKDISTRNEKDITEDTSTRNEKEVTKDTSTRNEKDITEDTSTRNEKEVTVDASTRNEKKITEDTSSRNEEITEDTSIANKKQVGEESQGYEKQITYGNSSGNKQKTTEDNNPENGKQVTENNSTRSEVQTTEVTEDVSTRNEKNIKGQTTTDNSTGNEQTTVSTGFINQKPTLAEANLGNEKQVTEGTGNVKLTTKGTSFGNENMTPGSTNLENKIQMIQTSEPGAYQPAIPKNEEKSKLLSGTEDKDKNDAQHVSICHRILSLNGLCCHICFGTCHT